jgi:hypothetical protein
MSDKKQTAIDWLFKNLNPKPITKEDHEQWWETIAKAKQMEKEQIKEAFKYGEMPELFINFNAEQYYNETYGKDNE